VSLDIDFEYSSNLDGMEDAIKNAIAKKLVELTELCLTKVQENLSGKILNKGNGQLYNSAKKVTYLDAAPMVGEVFIDPITPKAITLEKGRDAPYWIAPVKAQFLRFFSKNAGKIVYSKGLMHPGSVAFGYMEDAYEQMLTLVPEGFEMALAEVLNK